MNAGLGFRQTPESPDMNCKHAECTDNAWISLTRFAEAKANSSAVLNDSILTSTLSSGSNGDMESASSTNPRSHEGESGFETGKARRAPFMNLHIKGFCPTVLLSKPMWQADIAARYTFTVENAFPWSIKSWRNDRTTATEHWKGISCLVAHQRSNTPHLYS